MRLADDAGPDSFSFLSVLQGKQKAVEPVRGPVVMQAGSTPSMMIRSGDWKLITQLGSGGFSAPKQVQPGPNDPEGQLYNLRDDRRETKNLYLEHPRIVARLKGELDQIVQAERSR